MMGVMLLGAVLAIGLLLGWGLGGALRNLALVQVRLWQVFPAALALQVLPVPGGGGSNLPFVALVLSYLFLIGVTALNWRLRGFPLILVGLVLNAIPIFINQGMPVSAEAVVAAGGSVDEVPREPGGKHHLATAEDDLTFLGDVIAVRAPFQAVVSIGDLLMYSGAAVFLAGAMLASPRRPRPPPSLPRRPARPSRRWGSRRSRSSPVPGRSGF
jgi:hypothetical protein